MPRRKWDSNKKSEIVMRGLKGAVIADLCAEYGISQTQYYQWRDQFLTNSWKAFEDNTRREEQLLKQNSKLKGLVGELTLELKKKRRGLAVRRRQRSLKVDKRNESVLKRIKELKSEHPFWSYRRIWAQLTYGKDKLKINKKRVLRLLREHNLLAGSKRAFKASREVDTKKVVGYYAGSQCKAGHWLMALNMAVNRQFPDGARGRGLNLMSDNGSQPTATRFMKDCDTLGISQAFTSYNNPKGNADTERMFRTLKEELLWLQEWRSPVELGQKLEKWVADYNATYLHSTLGYSSPETFEKLYCESQKSTIEVA